MRTLRSPHNVELKTPEAKFCLDFDLMGAPVYIPATSFVRINVYACIGEKRVSSSPGNPDGASTSRRQVSRYDYARSLLRFSARDYHNFLLENFSWTNVRAQFAPEASQIGKGIPNRSSDRFK